MDLKLFGKLNSSSIGIIKKYGFNYHVWNGHAVGAMNYPGIQGRDHQSGEFSMHLPPPLLLLPAKLSYFYA